MMKKGTGGYLKKKDKDILYDKYGPGTINFTECDLCGNVQFVSSIPGTVRDINIAAVESDECELCDSIKENHPRIFKWAKMISEQLERKAGL